MTIPHKPLRDDVRLLGELLGDTLRALEGEALFETRRGGARAREARARRRPHASSELAERLSRAADRRRRSDGAGVRALPHARQHRRAASSHPPAARLRARPGAPPAARFVRRCVRALARRRHVAPMRSPSAVAIAADRAGAHGASDRDASAARCCRRIDRIADAARRPRPAGPDAGANPTRRSTRCGARSRRSGRPTKCATARVTPLDEVRGGLAVFEQTLWDALPRYVRQLDRALGEPLRRSTRRRCASDRGLAAIATAIPTSRRR